MAENNCYYIISQNPLKQGPSLPDNPITPPIPSKIQQDGAAKALSIGKEAALCLVSYEPSPPRPPRLSYTPPPTLPEIEVQAVESAANSWADVSYAGNL